MTTNKTTNINKISEDADRAMSDLRSTLRTLRRANAAMGACATILSQHGTNRESLPHQPGVYIQLTEDDAASLCYAIQTCSTFICERFERLPMLGDVMWDDEYLPEVRRKAETREQMLSDDIRRFDR